MQGDGRAGRIAASLVLAVALVAGLGSVPAIAATAATLFLSDRVSSRLGSHGAARRGPLNGRRRRGRAALRV